VALNFFALGLTIARRNDWEVRINSRETKSGRISSRTTVTKYFAWLMAYSAGDGAIVKLKVKQAIHPHRNSMSQYL
jgi:hypothetical protein